MALLISVNAGLPRDVTWEGRSVTTGTSKLRWTAQWPCVGTISTATGRQTSRFTVALPKRSTCIRPSTTIFGAESLGTTVLAWDSFGENFTVDGLDEEAVCIGDEFRVGSARVVVIEPRMPCFKLGIRFGRADMVKRFLKSQRTGFHFGVVEEGLVQVGDEFQQVAEHPDKLRVADVTRLYTTERTNETLLRKASSVLMLPEKWRAYFQYQLEKLLE